MYSDHNNQSSAKAGTSDVFMMAATSHARFQKSKKPVQDFGIYESSLRYFAELEIPQTGIDMEKLSHLINTRVVDGAIHQNSKMYLAFPDKGSEKAAQYASLLTGMINQNQIADEKSAPTGTYVEMAVVNWLRQLIDYKTDNSFPSNALKLGGAFVSGGVLANTIGLLGARQKKFPNTKTQGMASLQNGQAKVFVAGSTMSHYSHFGAAWWLGFGTDNVIETKVTSSGRMDTNDLEAQIIASRERGEVPTAIIVVMGDSRTNTLENLPGVYSIAKKYSVWLHADAAHGGILAFDKGYTYKDRHVLSYSDSITLDPHKHMGVPYSNSLVLFKDPDNLAAIGSSTDITIAYDSCDIGQITPFLGSRPFDALKLFAVIMNKGTDGIYRSIQKRREIVKKWHALLTSSELLEPLHNPELFAQALTAKPKPGQPPEELSEINNNLHNALLKKGGVTVHKFGIRDYRDALGYGMGTKITGLGSFFTEDSYTKEDLRLYISDIESTLLEIL